MDTAPEAVAHDQFVALAQLSEEERDGREVVAAVRVTNDDIGAASRPDPAAQGASVARLDYGDNLRSVFCSDLLGSVGTAVVGDDYLG